MRQNITRVQERGENVDRLGDKTQGLSDSAANFRRGANRVRKQMFWKNMKMRVWVIIGIIVLLCLIVIPSKRALRGKCREAKSDLLTALTVAVHFKN